MRGHRSSGAFAKLALSIVAPLVLALLLAGAWSLLTGRSVRHLFAPAPATMRIHFDEERAAAMARQPGEFRTHPDPRVGYTLPRSATFRSLGALVRTDELGLRQRAGPPPAEGARTIVVLGDSVAFGTGVSDEECLAQRLEDELARARADDGPRDWICRTVAVPGWNWRNAWSFLEDHLDRLRPSIVLYLPIGNDLSDTEAVWETGHRRVAPDLAQQDPLLLVSLARTQLLVWSYWPKVKRGDLALSEDDLGPLVLNADLGGESARRYDAMAAAIAHRTVELAARGVRCALLRYEGGGFTAALARRLAALAPSLPWIPLLDEVRGEDQLEDDPHPNATVHRALAAWIAGDLVGELGWLEGSLSSDGLPAGYAGRRAQRVAAGEWSRLAEAERAAARALLSDEIVPQSGRGVQQILGGLSPAGTVGPRLLAALPRRAGFLEVTLAPLAGRPDLDPLEVAVEVDGALAGTLTVRASADGAPAQARFALEPAPLDREDGASCDTFDVKLLPSRYATIEELGGLELASCRLVRLALAAGAPVAPPGSGER